MYGLHLTLCCGLAKTAADVLVGRAGPTCSCLRGLVLVPEGIMLCDTNLCFLEAGAAPEGCWSQLGLPPRCDRVVVDEDARHD